MGIGLVLIAMAFPILTASSGSLANTAAMPNVDHGGGGSAYKNIVYIHNIIYIYTYISYIWQCAQLQLHVRCASCQSCEPCDHSDPAENQTKHVTCAVARQGIGDGSLKEQWAIMADSKYQHLELLE